MSFVEIVERGRSPRPYPIELASQVGGYVILFGYSLKESTGSNAAELDIFSGTDNRGTLAIPITVGAGGSTEEWFGPQGIHMRGGLFSQVVAGAMVGSLFVHLVGNEEWR